MRLNSEVETQFDLASFYQLLKMWHKEERIQIDNKTFAYGYWQSFGDCVWIWALFSPVFMITNKAVADSWVLINLEIIFQGL